MPETGVVGTVIAYENVKCEWASATLPENEAPKRIFFGYVLALTGHSLSDAPVQYPRKPTSNASRDHQRGCKTARDCGTPYRKNVFSQDVQRNSQSWGQSEIFHVKAPVTREAGTRQEDDHGKKLVHGVRAKNRAQSYDANARQRRKIQQHFGVVGKIAHQPSNATAEQSRRGRVACREKPTEYYNHDEETNTKSNVVEKTGARIRFDAGSDEVGTDFLGSNDAIFGVA